MSKCRGIILSQILQEVNFLGTNDKALSYSNIPLSFRLLAKMSFLIVNGHLINMKSYV